MKGALFPRRLDSLEDLGGHKAQRPGLGERIAHPPQEALALRRRLRCPGFRIPRTSAREKRRQEAPEQWTPAECLQHHCSFTLGIGNVAITVNVEPSVFDRAPDSQK